MTETPGPNELRDPLVRRELQRALIWVGLVVAVALLWMLAQPLLLILAGVVLAAMLDGGTRLLGRVLPIARGWRLAIILLMTVAFFAWLLLFAGSQLAGQAAELQQVILLQFDRAMAW
ncbi:MAG: AI-2E family transporter, partial [Sphingopyxis sp.]